VDYLEQWAGRSAPHRAVAHTTRRLADACRKIAEIVSDGPLAGQLGEVIGDNPDGDSQVALDIRAEAILVSAMRDAPVACFISEESATPIVNDPSQPLMVAFDPLDGSSNIDTNVSIGTIFSISPVPVGANRSEASPQLCTGVYQLAAGYVIYGPQTALVLTVGEGTHIFTLNRKTGEYLRTEKDVQIPPRAREFAINVSNFRHWDAPVRAYIDDCLDGMTGIRGDNFNMRWVASLVADCHRILSRGGIYLYPADSRTGYAHGRLRLVYEANAIAFLVEQAGGRASTGLKRILEVEPTDVHQRVPLIFGSANEVRRVTTLCADPNPVGERSQLFENCSLLLS
jgi:fructose-1,6-bisphosphatase I